ncbi:MAG TPA: AMP-binding protein [Stellaceae bacterium]|jgi:long-chain acyl-CoA synthetase|nr:AMP-binding protein [Stellaceae bacterium]
MALAQSELPARPMGQPDEALDTFPKLLLDHARRHGERPAMREKDLGIWQSWSWRDAAREVQDFAAGLAALGFRRGDKLGIIGDNRPRLYWAIAAAQCLGGVPVPVYQDAIASEMEFVLDHAEARFVLAEDQEQVDKLLAVKERLPRLEAIIYDDARGMRHYAYAFLRSWDAVQEEGRRFAATRPRFLADAIAQGSGSDIAVILYTSGTTGQPKGVMLTHRNVLSSAKSAAAREGLRADDEVLAYLPIAWAGDHIFSYAQSYATGFCVSCPESAGTVMTDLRELGPTYFFAPPRIYENILTQVMIRMEDAGWAKRRLFHYFMALARRVGGRILDRETVSAKDRLLYALGDALIYGPLKNTLGFSRIRLAYTAGEAIGPDLFTFYRSLGINIKQLYAMTEASILCVQPDGEVKPDTVGTALPSVELLIADNGEVLYRGPAVFAGYYKNATATAAAKRPDGWVHSGDAGFLGDDGHLRIIDRAKDVGKLQDGTLFAPKFIENKLKFFPFIKEAVAFGRDRQFVTAIINIDPGAVGNWAERNGITYGGYQELASLPAVYDLVQGCIEQVNRDFAAESHLAGSQIRRFLILHKELEADDGELTRTRKVRRGFIGERYQPLVDALYADAPTASIESEVTFEDGRRGTLKAELQIRDAKTAAAVAMLRRR